jgi:hypothetical protein
MEEKISKNMRQKKYLFICILSIVIIAAIVFFVQRNSQDGLSPITAFSLCDSLNNIKTNKRITWYTFSTKDTGLYIVKNIGSLSPNIWVNVYDGKIHKGKYYISEIAISETLQRNGFRTHLDSLDLFHQSYTYFEAKAGKTYFIEWVNLENDSLVWELKKTPGSIGVLKNKAITLNDTSHNIIADHTYSGYLWYSFKSSKDAYYTISNCGKTENWSHLTIYTEGLAIVLFGSICGNGKIRIFKAEKDLTYFINWYGSGKYLWEFNEEVEMEDFTDEEAKTYLEVLFGE